LNPGPSTSDPGLPTAPFFPEEDSELEESDDSYPRPSTSDPVTPAPQPHSPTPPDESEIYFSDLFRGRLKRRISGSSSVNAAQRNLEGTLDSREYLSASA
jgi:hypothetical protein